MQRNVCWRCTLSASFLQLPFTGSATLPVCFFVDSFSPQVLYGEGAACGHLPPNTQTKECYDQLVSRAALLTLYKSCNNKKKKSSPQCPPGEPPTWKHFRAFETIQSSFPCPCTGMKGNMCHPAVLPAAKFRSGNCFPSQSPQGLCSH